MVNLNTNVCSIGQNNTCEDLYTTAYLLADIPGSEQFSESKCDYVMFFLDDKKKYFML